MNGAPQGRGGNASHVRLHNRAGVLRALLEEGPASRKHLAQRVGLTHQAISYIAGELLEAGLVVPVAAPAGRQLASRSPGRQEQPLELSARAGHVAAVYLGEEHVHLGITDLRATPRARRLDRLEVAWKRSAPRFAQIVRERLKGLAEEAGIDPRRLLGAGVSVWGNVDGEAGLVRHHPQLGWRDVPLADALESTLGLPVALEHGVRALALSEAWLGAGRGSQSMALLLVGRGVGCALVRDRRIPLGLSSAGDLGMLPPAFPEWADAPPDARAVAEVTRAAAPQTLEEAVSEPAMRRWGAAIADRFPESAVAAWVRAMAHGENVPSAALAQQALAHGGAPDGPALALLQWRAAVLAPVVATVLSLYAPETLVITAGMAGDGGVQVRLLEDAVKRHAPAVGERMPRFISSAHGAEGLIASAAALILRHLYDSNTSGTSAATTSDLAGAIHRRALGAARTAK